MYPPPSEEILQRLMHSDLDMVGHCRFVVHLTFENKNRLSFSAPFRFGESLNISTAAINEFPLPESKITRVLGCQVSQVKCDPDGTLELQFSNGNLLIVYANDPAYEAYTLLIDGKEYVV